MSALSSFSLTDADLDRLNLQVAVCYQQAEAFYLKNFSRPAVLVNLRGRSAGIAELQKNRLRFNPVLYAENRAVFLDQVVPHEVAHLLAWQLYGRKIRPHGPEWQDIMRLVFGQQPRRTHDFDVGTVQGRIYLYTCGCPQHQHQLTVRRHNRILRGQGYVCRRCRQRLVFCAEVGSD